MSMMLMVKAMQTKVGNPLRKLVLIKLADNANDQGECWPSYQHIADQCEIARSTVRKHIKELESMGLLKIEHRDGPKGNSSNLYHLSLHPVVTKSTGVPSDSIGGVPSDSTRTSHSLETIKEPINSFNFEEIKASWNKASIESNCISKKTIVFPEKAKKDLPKIYKKYEAIKKSLGKEPESKNNFCKSYFKAVLDWAEPWAGKGNMESFKVSLEYSVRMDTFDKVMNWVAGE